MDEKICGLLQEVRRSISLSPALVSAATDCLEATCRLGFRVLKASRLDLDLEVVQVI